MALGVYVVQSEIKTDKMRYSVEEHGEDDEKSGSKPILRLPSKQGEQASKYSFALHINCLFLWKWWSNFFVVVSLFVQKIRLKHAYIATMLHLFSKLRKRTRREKKRLLILPPSSSRYLRSSKKTRQKKFL